MADVDELGFSLDGLDDPPAAPPQQQQAFEKDLYKKWFRTKDRAGFVSLRPFFKAGKVVIDIGKADPNSSALLSSSEAYVDVVQLGTYLRAIVEGRAAKLYPKSDYLKVDTDEGLTIFGGKGTLSRVFKAHHWPGKDKGTYDSSAFQWKVGHFEGKESSNGLIMPDWQKPKSVDSIKVTRTDIAEISYTLDIALQAYAVQNKDWLQT